MIFGDEYFSSIQHSFEIIVGLLSPKSSSPSTSSVVRLLPNVSICPYARLWFCSPPTNELFSKIYGLPPTNLLFMQLVRVEEFCPMASLSVNVFN
jgi:hypothetical protein